MEILRERRLFAVIWALKTAPWLVYRYVHARHVTEYSFLH